MYLYHAAKVSWSELPDRVKPAFGSYPEALPVGGVNRRIFASLDGVWIDTDDALTMKEWVEAGHEEIEGWDWVQPYHLRDGSMSVRLVMRHEPADFVTMGVPA